MRQGGPAPPETRALGTSLVRSASCLIIAATIAEACAAEPAAWLIRSPWFQESWGTRTEPAGVRIHVNYPLDGVSTLKSTRLVLFALPNGNTLEQTLGCRAAEGLDWHFDIQHVAAQTRLLRTISPQERFVLAAVEAQGLSWPAWRASRADADDTIVALLDRWRQELTDDAPVALAAHSGGGSFLHGFIEGHAAIPAWIDTIAFLDANYSFDAAKHAAKLLDWLRGDPARRLVVLAYDDREITFQGKKIVGETGGTYRATRRMADAFAAAGVPLVRTDGEPFVAYEGLDGQIRAWVHKNPENKILHTALVGEMNGLLHALTTRTPLAERWGSFGGPRAYASWIQPAPTPADPADRSAAAALPPLAELPPLAFPPRRAGAIGGTEFARRIADLPRERREAAIFAEIAAGNVPEFLRKLQRVAISATDADGRSIEVVVEVAPDVLAVGSDADFLRIPMTPQTAQRLADRLGCTLPTRKLVDAIDAAATVRLAPQPLTEDRESVAAFVESNRRIEIQRGTNSLEALVTGAKKDVVLSPRIFERPDRVAIYGWRQLDGEPIQPLTIVHVDWYVDYSHGVRLIRNAALVDGKAVAVTDLLSDPRTAGLVSDEGPMIPSRYPVP
ncbi:MAG: hypothetical protein KF847_07140 [Pirellulales bacterium]|nr:hypothetical protein [Pirellulales bacterium]